MRCFIITFIVFIIWASWATKSKGDETSRKPLEWSTKDSKVLLGSPQGNYFISVEAPDEFVVFAKSILQGDPNSWVVFNDENDILSGKKVVFITDVQKQMITVVTQPDRWLQMENPGGPLAISSTEEKVQKSDILRDPLNTSRWMVAMLSTYQGEGARMIMDKRLRDEIFPSQEYKSWMNGAEKSRDKFYSLFHDPLIVRQGTMAVISCDVITEDGAVKEWTFIVHATDVIQVLSIKSKDLYPKKSFSWGLNM